MNGTIVSVLVLLIRQKVNGIVHNVLQRWKVEDHVNLPEFLTTITNYKQVLIYYINFYKNIIVSNFFICSQILNGSNNS